MKQVTMKVSLEMLDIASAEIENYLDGKAVPPEIGKYLEVVKLRAFTHFNSGKPVQGKTLCAVMQGIIDSQSKCIEDDLYSTKLRFRFCGLLTASDLKRKSA